MPRTRRIARTKSKKRAATASKPRRQPSSALLVVECDAPRLAAQGLALGRPITDLIRSLHPRAKIELIQTSTLAELGRSLGETGQVHKRFRLIVLIGHSNESGIQWTSDRFLSWAEVGAWLNYFGPTSVFLTACDAGRLPVARHLFTAIRELKRVYGSPTKLAVNQNHPLVICVLDELGRRGLSAEGRQMIQALNLLFTRGLMFRWMRGEVMGTGKQRLRSVGVDIAARVLDKWLSQAH